MHAVDGSKMPHSDKEMRTWANYTAHTHTHTHTYTQRTHARARTHTHMRTNTLARVQHTSPASCSLPMAAVNMEMMMWMCLVLMSLKRACQFFGFNSSIINEPRQTCAHGELLMGHFASGGGVGDLESIDRDPQSPAWP
jgi:hypothetical protein